MEAPGSRTASHAPRQIVLPDSARVSIQIYMGTKGIISLSCVNSGGWKQTMTRWRWTDRQTGIDQPEPIGWLDAATVSLLLNGGSIMVKESRASRYGLIIVLRENKVHFWVALFDNKITIKVPTRLPPSSCWLKPIKQVLGSLR